MASNWSLSSPETRPSSTPAHNRRAVTWEERILSSPYSCENWHNRNWRHRARAGQFLYHETRNADESNKARLVRSDTDCWRAFVSTAGKETRTAVAMQCKAFPATGAVRLRTFCNRTRLTPWNSIACWLTYRQHACLRTHSEQNGDTFKWQTRNVSLQAPQPVSVREPFASTVHSTWQRKYRSLRHSIRIYLLTLSGLGSKRILTRNFEYTFCRKIKGPGKLSRYIDSPRAGRSGNRIPMEKKFSAPIQTGLEAHPQQVPNHSWVESSQGVALTTQPHLAPRLKKE